MPQLHQNITLPASNFQGWLATLINTVFGLAGASMTTAVQGATNIATLREAIEDLSLHKKDEHFQRQLSHQLQAAYDLGLMDDADIAALTTINTASATTDLLYLVAGQYDSDYDANYYGFHAPFVTIP
jgi:hypothetical protein